MGFWNGKVDGPLDKMFDFNRDGKLNAWERAMELGLLMDDEDDYRMRMMNLMRIWIVTLMMTTMKKMMKVKN